MADTMKVDGPMSQTRAAKIVRTLAQALGAVHRRGIVHRDLKPTNIRVDADGMLVIVGFHLTPTHQFGRVRTSAYTAPELLMGHVSTTDCAPDIYSLGVILYEMWTGHHPFEGQRAHIRAVSQRPLPPSVYRQDLDPELEAICLKSLAESPRDRWSSMDAFAEALGEASGRLDHQKWRDFIARRELDSRSDDKRSPEPRTKRTSSPPLFAMPHADAGLASYTAGLVVAAAFMALSLGPGWAGFLVGFLPLSLLTSWAVASHA